METLGKTNGKLTRWLERMRWSQIDLARRLECDPSLVSHWCRGRARPGLAMASALEMLSGGAVRAVDWAPPAVRRAPKRRAPARAAA